MQYRQLGTSGIRVSAIALGCWAFAGDANWGPQEDAASIATVHAALDAGINFFDTADVYGAGRSETVLGQALAGLRTQAVIATKVSPDHLSAYEVRLACERSLRCLKTDYIDLYQTHWPDIDTPVEDTMATLLDLKAQGKIRAIGVSNVDVDLLKQYAKKGVVDTDQELFSMLDKGVEEELLPYCREQNISMLAYSPLAQGLLTGKITPEREFKEGDFRQSNPRFSVENRIRIMEILKKFEPVIDKHQISFSQLAIAWTFSQPGMTHALVGARNAFQATENAAAGDIMLDDEDMGIINNAINEVALAQ
jgi:aryl-alcohol dehydrogenase-like predicted oxidoreductase